MRAYLKAIRKVESEADEGVCAVFSDKTLHRRGLSVTRATANGAPDAEVRALGSWGGADAMRDAYVHGPPVRALMAVAGCQSNFLYYTDYARSRLPVPETLKKRLWPWLESLEALAEECRRNHRPGHDDVDHKLESFVTFMFSLRTVFYQDMAISRAIEIDRVTHAWERCVSLVIHSQGYTMAGVK